MTKVIGIAGYSNSGKTTLITKLVPWFESHGYRVGVIKHDAHGHYSEVEGADSTQFIESGASCVAVVSPEEVRWFERKPVQLEDVVKRMEPSTDIILVEGFKREPHPKIAVFHTKEQADIIRRTAMPPIAWVTANAEDAAEAQGSVPVFHPEAVEEVGGFILGLVNEDGNHY
ncbi:molybdopterin-guanine dinucleotide biosynthesis protein B [Paenibacillus cremeus]|uniref:Molybdopterin-guanine dinucleotide biosynthesis protein B n=1 Tax=Paenibacillus cremeus TaxID=2163881 RepID=A0A559K800_9BACL|nr:molybdopterin-guanine dinucleotide biosynthesis protein B [Paenibacillus cremeus]TVY08265.1 molybdopterin-guanine dinucleotide biosynthesis protein B [Paenibacillus cremeus]